MKLLSDDICEEAVEPEVLGADKVLSAVRKPKRRFPLWLGYSAGVLAVIVFAAVVFPVFSQTKYAAKNAAHMGNLAMKAPDSFAPPESAKVDLEKSSVAGRVPAHATAMAKSPPSSAYFGANSAHGASPVTVTPKAATGNAFQRDRFGYSGPRSTRPGA